MRSVAGSLTRRRRRLAAAAAVAAPFSTSAAAAQIQCRTSTEVRSVIQRVYGEALWRRMHQPPPSPSFARPPPLPAVLHVTSLFQPPAAPGGAHSSSRPNQAGDGGDGAMYTLQVGGAHAPRHALDVFALSLARGLAREVVHSGQVLRLEPSLRCEVHPALLPGFAALRTELGSTSTSPHPALSVLTRARSLDGQEGGEGEGGAGVDFAHPMFDAHDGPGQPVTLWHAQESFAESIRRCVKPESVHQGPQGGLQVELGTLVEAQQDHRSKTSSSLLQPRSLHHPHKLIEFRCTHHNADLMEVVRLVQERSSLRGSATGPSMPPFMAQLSIEAGPAVTRHLYGSDLLSSSAASTSSSGASSVVEKKRQPMVDTLLLSVYRGRIPPEQYREFLVYPASSSTLLPPPTLTWQLLDKFYCRMSEYRCPVDPDWSFFWYERKELG